MKIITFVISVPETKEAQDFANELYKSHLDIKNTYRDCTVVAIGSGNIIEEASYLTEELEDVLNNR